MQTDNLPAYRFTAEVPGHQGSRQKVEMAYVIEAQGLSVTRGRSVSFVPWTSLRFLHLHVTSGVGTTGFPVYSARLRTRFVSREIASLDWQDKKGVDRSTDYVRFMETLIPFAAARNPHLRFRHGGDPMLETAIPMILSIFMGPFIFLLLMVVKLPAAFLTVATKKPLAKLAPWLFSLGFGVALNALPWSSGKPFKPDDLPVVELPPRYREGSA